MAPAQRSSQAPRPGPLRVAVPSDGEMHDPTLAFLRACGMPVERPNARRYTARIAGLDRGLVLFQRAADITSKVEEGSADLGIVGLDRFREHCHEGGDALLVIENLGFSQCELVLAVPDTWVDVTSMADIADLAVEFRESGREFRVATKYPRLVQRFLFHHGINYFTLVQASGTLEAAPLMGYADVIGDIIASGVTLRENRLKTLEDGSILTSQACLIGNRRLMGQDTGRLEAARCILERIEAYLGAGDFYRVTANVQGASEEVVAAQIWERPDLAGLHGPTISQVHGPEGTGWYAVTVVVHKGLLMDAVDHFRAVGGSTITVAQANYIFHRQSGAYRRLFTALEREDR